MAAVVTTAPGAQGAPQVTPEIAAAPGHLPLQVRNTTDALLHAAPRDATLYSGRKTLLVCGAASEIIVQHSALSAASPGLHLQVVVDA